jgi:thiamine biosynthesis lipoprotein
MACDNEIQLDHAAAEEAARVSRLAIEEVHRIEQRYSRYRDDSVLSKINAAAGKHALTVDAETAALLDYGDACYRKSAGLFDLTSGVLRRCWNFREPLLPDPKQLRDTLRLVGWDNVQWKRPEIFLPIAGMELDFGGIGKEYAADRAVHILVAQGVQHGFVNLGGDIRVIGPRVDGTPWNIGIQHPRQVGAVLAGIDIAQGALATSGDYERFFELDGQRYCHVLNPRTGYPVTGIMSVSVVAPLCTVAGSLTTIAMLKGAAGEAFLRENEVPFLIVNADGKLSASALQPIFSS